MCHPIAAYYLSRVMGYLKTMSTQPIYQPDLTLYAHLSNSIMIQEFNVHTTEANGGVQYPLSFPSWGNSLSASLPLSPPIMSAGQKKRLFTDWSRSPHSPLSFLNKDTFLLVRKGVLSLLDRGQQMLTHSKGSTDMGSPFWTGPEIGYY